MIPGDLLNSKILPQGNNIELVLAEREYESLQNYKWVADRLEMVRRLTILSWSHHQAARVEFSRRRENLIAAAGVIETLGPIGPTDAARVAEKLVTQVTNLHSSGYSGPSRPLAVAFSLPGLCNRQTLSTQPAGARTQNSNHHQ